ncbi:MAG: hypothetical protein R6X19_09550, partial [Kiritimatiellia bacterium]
RCNSKGWASLVCAAAGVPADAFKVGERARLYEIGAGDVFRTPTKVSLTRDGTAWRLEANVPCGITIRGAGAQWSADGKRWADLPAGRTLKVTAEQLAAGGPYLRGL